MSEAQDTPEMMQRRELLRRAAWLLGGAVSAPAALAILQGCSARAQGVAITAGDTSWKGKVLSAEESAVVSAIADILIPRTETHGALDAGVPLFIDSVLGAVYSKDARDRFKAGCAKFNAPAQSAGGKSFLEQDGPARTATVKQAIGMALSSRGHDKPFILMARELTLLGFFSSEVGITENMEYVAVPTAFHGCVPLSQLGKHVYWE